MPALNKNAIALLASVADVDMNTATPTALFTVPQGATGCVITHIVVKGASISLTTASYSFGWNASDYDDVIADAVHDELTGATLYTALAAKIGAKLGVAGDVLKALMNTLQGVSATATIEVFGYLF
jgi:hypothetical protein